MAIESAVETITPAIARQYLKKNTNNYRKMSRSVVRSYAEDIKNGRWELNGETIIFGKDGILMDGQHRLAGIIQAGKPIDVLVVRGVETSAHKIDIGKKRSDNDILNAEGFECDGTLVAAANIIVNRFSGVRNGTSVQEYVKRNYPELSRAMRVTCLGTGSKSKNAPSVAATYLMFRTKAMPSYEVELFFRLLNDFDNTFADGYETSPVRIAQQMFDERAKTHGGSLQVQKERLEILIMAMKDFHDGKKRETRYKIKEPFEFMTPLSKIRKEDGLE